MRRPGPYARPAARVSCATGRCGPVGRQGVPPPPGIAGCISLGRQYEGAVLPIEKLGGVRVGETTKSDVLSMFGAPTAIQRRDIEGLLAGFGTRYRGNELTVKIGRASCRERV